MTMHFLQKAAAFSFASYMIYQVTHRLSDSVDEQDAFAQHTNRQHRQHPFSGMHIPYIPTREQRKMVDLHFPQWGHLLPSSLEILQNQHLMATAVKIHSLQQCPISYNANEAKTLVVGGAPALISSMNQPKITYVYNRQKIPIAQGSNWHLQWDASTQEQPYDPPMQFFIDQVMRALFVRYTLSAAEKTGNSPFRSLDWNAWLHHPREWGAGLRIAASFQRAIRNPTPPSKEEKISRCYANERFYHQLNEALGDKLLMPYQGSMMIARNQEEKQALTHLKEDLKEEGRTLNLLSLEELQEQLSFCPHTVVACAEKKHDRILSPHFTSLLCQRITDLGGQILPGVLTNIYVDDPEKGGVAEIYTTDGIQRFISFSELILSLGDQRIIGRDGKPLFDVVSERGVSMLAIAHVPQGKTLPSVMTFGNSNHITTLSGPTPIEGKDHTLYDGYLLRMTAGQCITPNVSGKESANYDGIAATALVSAARQTFDCHIEVLTAYGCNRQVSEYKELHWFTLPKEENPKPRFSLTPRGHDLDLGTYRPQKSGQVLIQIGAGHSGLAQAPSQPPLKE